MWRIVLACATACLLTASCSTSVQMIGIKHERISRSEVEIVAKAPAGSQEVADITVNYFSSYSGQASSFEATGPMKRKAAAIGANYIVVDNPSEFDKKAFQNPSPQFSSTPHGFQSAGSTPIKKTVTARAYYHP